MVLTKDGLMPRIKKPIPNKNFYDNQVMQALTEVCSFYKSLQMDLFEFLNDTATHENPDRTSKSTQEETDKDAQVVNTPRGHHIIRFIEN